MDDGAQKKNHNLMETVIIIEGVPEEMSNSRSRGKDRQHDLHFLIHVLGVKRNDITNCYRYGQRTDGKTRPLACELLDKRAFGLWTDYGAMKLVGDYKVQSFKSWYLTKDITLAMTGLESAIRRASLSDSPRSRRAGIVQPPHIILSTGNTIPLSVLNNPSSCLKRLGKGFFGTVYLFKARLNQIAIKEIEIPTSLVPKEGRDVFEEVELQKDLRHPNIIQYYGSYQSEEHICILMEHASNGSLKDLLLKEGRLDDKRVLSFTKQILEGLNYLHTRPRMIIHRDLRSPNVLICDYGRVKIADFGVSKQLNTLATSSGFNTAVGNLFWQAPELLKSDSALMGRKVDIWSLGITMLEMVYVRPPMFELEPCRYMFKLGFESKVPDIPNFVEPKVQEVMSYCLAYDVSERKTAAEILKLVFDLVIKEE